MKYCKNCNNMMEDDEIYCSNCGTKYEETQENIHIEEVPDNKSEGKKSLKGK